EQRPKRCHDRDAVDILVEVVGGKVDVLFGGDGLPEVCDALAGVDYKPGQVEQHGSGPFPSSPLHRRPPQKIYLTTHARHLLLSLGRQTASTTTFLVNRACQ